MLQIMISFRSWPPTSAGYAPQTLRRGGGGDGATCLVRQHGRQLDAPAIAPKAAWRMRMHPIRALRARSHGGIANPEDLGRRGLDDRTCGHLQRGRHIISFASHHCGDFGHRWRAADAEGHSRRKKTQPHHGAGASGAVAGINQTSICSRSISSRPVDRRRRS